MLDRAPLGERQPVDLVDRERAFPLSGLNAWLMFTPLMLKRARRSRRSRPRPPSSRPAAAGSRSTPARRYGYCESGLARLLPTVRRMQPGLRAALVHLLVPARPRHELVVGRLRPVERVAGEIGPAVVQDQLHADDVPPRHRAVRRLVGHLGVVLAEARRAAPSGRSAGRRSRSEAGCCWCRWAGRPSPTAGSRSPRRSR